MLRIHSFLQEIYSCIKSLSKQMYRTCAIVVTGSMVLAVISLSSASFGGSGKNRMTIHPLREIADEEKEEEEVDAEDRAKVQTISDSQKLETQSIVASERHTQIAFDAVITQGIQNRLIVEEVAKEMTVEEEMFLMKEGSERIAFVGDEIEMKKQEGVEVIEAAISQDAAYNSFAAHYEETEEEYQVLLHIVAAEAGGCDSVGQILVANAILNRVQSERFPNTITEVVYQKNQFAPVVNGVLWSSRVTDTVRDSVQRALAGEDYSKGALFFSAPAILDTNSMSWFDNNLHYMFSHDGHRFYTFKN